MKEGSPARKKIKTLNARVTGMNSKGKKGKDTNVSKTDRNRLGEVDQKGESSLSGKGVI